MQDKESALDSFLRHGVWAGLSPDRLIRLIEAADYRVLAPGERLFEQFHPATQFYLLVAGVATQSTASASGTGMVHHGALDWADAALGWSGFLPPRRYGSTVTAVEDCRLLSWPHEELAACFYADPTVAVAFFDLVLDSVGRQFASQRKRRVAATGALMEPPQVEPLDARRPVVGQAGSCLRRSAFFAPFEEAMVERLAAAATLESHQPGERIVRQGEAPDGLLLLASGRCSVFFETGDDADLRLLPFRSFRNRYGIISGVPALDERFVAEATVYADTHCWVYRLPAAAIRELYAEDPEFGRAFQQRLLVRLAGLLGAIQVERDAGEAEPEIAATVNAIANSRARLPVTSELYKVPHLLRHRLTIGNAFAVLNKVAETGRYHERLLGARLNDQIADLAAEHAFYQEILGTCEAVVTADESLAPEEIRALCDRRVADAYAYLDCRISGLERLPAAPGHIFILNHLACPEYYQLPNHYHFSFDTAFVSMIVWQQYGRSALRVVRESPGAEFGHNLFYQRLGHITVPTVESELEALSEAEFRARRREAARAFAARGRDALAAGANIVICPEGQSQPAELSPARFHTGAFRLALDCGVRIVPVALAGFHRRFKDGPLVAVIGEPVDVAAGMEAAGTGSLRQWVDAYRQEFAALVAAAARDAEDPARLHHPAR